MSTQSRPGEASAPLNRLLALPAGIGLGALLLLTALAFVLGNVVTGLFVLLVTLAMVNGWWLGASRIAAVLGGLFLAALLAAPMGKACEGLFGAALGSTGLANRIISIAVVGAIIVVVVTLGLGVVISRVRRHIPAWKRHDRLIGGGLGLAEGALLGLLLLWSILALEPIAATSLGRTGQEGTSNFIQRRVVDIAGLVRQSAVGRVGESINPLDELRLLRLFEDSLVVLNDPEARFAFVNNPAVERIRQRPAVREAIKRISDDPEISAIFESESIGASEVRAMLDSRELLAVLDGTNLVDELSHITDDIEQAIGESLQQRHSAAAFADLFPDVDAAVAEFAAGLGDPDAKRRVRAAHSLVMFGPKAAAAVPALITALDDEDEWVRAAAARALGSIGRRADGAVPRLRAALHDPDRDVRQAAQEALELIEPPQAGKGSPDR